MPRRTIAYLDTPTVDGRIIHGMTFPTGPVRLYLVTAADPVHFGWVDHYRIEERHGIRHVTAALTNTIPGLAPEVDTYGPTSTTDAEGRLVWESVLLTGVALGGRPAWHGLIER